MENQPYVYCGRWERHAAHGPTCPGSGVCGNREIHEPHLVLEGSLAPYWCWGSRIRLYREKRVTNDGRKLLATTWDEEPLPLLVTDEAANDKTGHFGAFLVGTITDVRRETDTGWVTGLLTMVKSWSISGLAAEADFRFDGDIEEVNGVMVATGARLMGVTLGKNPCWDEMVLP